MMSLKENINSDLKVAMKAKDKDSLAVIRMIKSAIQSAEIDKKAELDSQEELAILSREVKQRRDSLLEFEKAGRQDLVDHVKKEIEIVEKYLPKQLSVAEIQDVIKTTAAELSVDSMQGFGKLMGTVAGKLKGQADGNVIKDQVKAFLSK